MHQLAVVGGGRNANGVPGVFGPADGRGQSCMAFWFKFTQRLHFCVCFMDPRQFTTSKKAAQCYINWPFKKWCFLVTLLSQKPKLVKKSSKRNQQTDNACQKDLQYSLSKHNSNMILLHHIKTNLSKRPIFLSSKPFPLSIRHKWSPYVCMHTLWEHQKVPVLLCYAWLNYIAWS